MDTVTYPDPEVAAFIAAEFEAAQVHIGDPDQASRDSIRRYRLLWAPGFVVLGSKGDELRRFLGFQRPRDFIADLRMGLGKGRLLQRRYDEAFREFRATADLDPPAPVSDEGVYWAGIALHYRDKTDLEFLHQYWEELRRRFPESRWWTAADVFR